MIQGTFGMIQGTFVVIQGTFIVIQRIFSVIQTMMIISPFGQLGLWVPSSEVRDVFTSRIAAYVFQPPHH
jgi:hypothetical protein